MDNKPLALNYRRAEKKDAALLVDIYNASFYEDFIRYKQCPAYGRTIREMELSIEKFPKDIIIYQGECVGVISHEAREPGIYHIGCFCIIPEYQNRGIGTKAFGDFKERRADWLKISLITPADKVGNIHFYTKKCGMSIVGKMKDGNVDVVELQINREAQR